jgi:hypothetical protein
LQILPIEKNKKGEDINIGWHALIKEYAEGKQIISEPVSLGESGNWKNIDLLANHLITNVIAEPYRKTLALSCWLVPNWLHNNACACSMRRIVPQM